MRSHVLLGLTAAAVFATAAFAQETPATPAAEPAAPAVETPPAPPPPPPPAPTDLSSITILDTLTRVCAQSVRGGDMSALAPAAGFKKKKDLWVKTYAKGYTISIIPPGTNPRVCSVVLEHPIDGVTPIIIDLHNWAMAQGWFLYRNDRYVTDMERTTRSWESRGQGDQEAVVLMTVRKVDGSPVSKKFDRTEFLYTLQPAS